MSESEAENEDAIILPFPTEERPAAKLTRDELKALDDSPLERWLDRPEIEAVVRTKTEAVVGKLEIGAWLDEESLVKLVERTSFDLVKAELGKSGLVIGPKRGATRVAALEERIAKLEVEVASLRRALHGSESEGLMTVETDITELRGDFKRLDERTARMEGTMATSGKLEVLDERTKRIEVEVQRLVEAVGKVTENGASLQEMVKADRTTIRWTLWLVASVFILAVARVVVVDLLKFGG